MAPVCRLWNIIAHQTREGEVWQRLFDKLEIEREALGGQVFDVLGEMTFENKSLRELLIEAIRYGSDPERKALLDRILDLYYINYRDAINMKRLKHFIENNILFFGFILLLYIVYKIFLIIIMLLFILFIEDK